MIYELTIQLRGAPVLNATLEKRPDQQLRVLAAAIDHEGGQLSGQGMDAFRILSLAELIIGAALGLNTVDPFAAQVLTMQAEIDRLNGFIRGLQQAAALSQEGSP